MSDYGRMPYHDGYITIAVYGAYYEENGIQYSWNETTAQLEYYKNDRKITDSPIIAFWKDDYIYDNMGCM